MEQQPEQFTLEGPQPTTPDLEDVTAYEDDGALVICDKHNPSAWVRSEQAVSLQR